MRTRNEPLLSGGQQKLVARPRARHRHKMPAEPAG
jgi:hypothetical protein